MVIAIVGGGASGLIAAIAASKSPGCQVHILERQSRVGRKLLATGNGRCNLTNLDLSPVHYHGQDAGFARAALSRFDGTATLDFFHALGLLTTAEPSGRVYPLSDQSNSVVDVLRFAAAQAGVQLVCGFDAQSVKKKARGYQVTGADGSAYFGDKLIVACGGCAGKALGGTMSGYELLSQLGHSRTALHPSLTQIRTDPAPIRGLKGVRADCRIRLRADGRTIQEDAGEVQFTETGVSGPAAFTLSRAAGQAQGAGLLLDFLREYPAPQVRALLQARRETFPALAGEELMETGGIREDDSRGRHTTTHRQLFRLDSGAMVIDTPGMRELGMWDVSEGLSEAFTDVQALLGRCRFSDCRHQQEPGCAVREALETGVLSPERWESYQKLKQEARYADDKAGYLRQKQQWHKGISKTIRQMEKEGRVKE